MKINGEKVADFDEFVRPYNKCFKAWRWFDITPEARDYIKSIIKDGIPDPNYIAYIEVDGIVYKAIPGTINYKDFRAKEPWDIETVFELCIRTDD
jgi:hypothetical protein